MKTITFIVVAIIVSLVLLVLFNFKIKIFEFVGFIVGLIFDYYSNCREKKHIDDRNELIYKRILTISILICALSFGYDCAIGIISYIENSKTPDIYTEVNPHVVDEKQDYSTENYIPKKNISQETITSVSYTTPNQIENELTSEESYIPSVSDEIMDKVLFLNSVFKAEINSVNEYCSKSVEIINEKTQVALHIEDGYPIDELNGNKEVIPLLEQANEIDLQRKKENNVENNVKLMNKYKEAFKLAPCSTISLQLARPYEEIILIYPRTSYEECDEIFEYGSKAIKYFIQTLAYKRIDSSTDGDIIYRIAKIYHYLGDLPNLDVKYRTEMYQISSAYFELSMSLKDKNDVYNVYKPYYAAMVNHKLGVISNEDNDFYLKRALDYYQKSLLYSDISENMSKDANKFSAEICNRLIRHINKYGQNDGLKSIVVYEELAREYAEKSKY